LRPTLRITLLVAAFVSLAAVLLMPAAAHAGSMDPTPDRLVLQPSNIPSGTTCQAAAATATATLNASLFPCAPANNAFMNMVSELGFAIAPTAFHPARTTGFGGFALTLEASYSHINANGMSNEANGTHIAYWQQGTQGPTNPNTNQFSTVNQNPDSLLQIYTLKARKGLPFGFELVGALGYIANTTMWVGGADVRWALLEGFRTGLLGVLPDIAVGSGVRTLTGTSKFDLTTVGIDAQVSKPIALADSSSLTPYVGYQRLYVFGDSGIINLTPGVDAVQACGERGITSSGQPICSNPNAIGDFNNNVVFTKVRTHYNRGIVGLNYRYEMLYVASQFLFSLTDPTQDNPGLTGARQWTLSFEAGVYF
jgi:hypothetical protein